MDSWLQYFIQVNLYLLLVGLSFEFGFRKSQNFKFGRPFLLISSFLSFILPLIKLPEAVQFSQTIQLDGIIMNAIEVGVQTQPSFIIDWWLVVKTILLTGFSIRFIHCLIGIYKLQQIKNKSVKKEGYYEVLNSVCAFSFMNAIFIGSKIPSDKKEIILKHELIHVKRNHSIDVLLTQLMQCILWYNPLSYKVSSYLKEVHEFEADHHASINKEEYIELLLQQNFQNFNFSIIHQFNSNHLKNRIMRLNKNTPKISLTALVLTIGLFAFLFLNHQSASSKGQLFSDEATTKLVKTSSFPEIIQIQGENKDTTLPLPNYPGGMDNFINFISKNVKYPEDMKKQDVQATVYTRIFIDDKGKVESIQFMNATTKSFEKEVTRVIELAEDFIPAEKDGKRVKTYISIPVRFKLNLNEKMVDKKAEFPGGQKAMSDFIIGNTIYTKKMVENKITGKVYVEFVVEKDGSLNKIKAIKSDHKELERFAIKIVNKMPKWEPAEKDGKKVATKMVLPIKFGIPPMPPAPPVKPVAPKRTTTSPPAPPIPPKN